MERGNDIEGSVADQLDRLTITFDNWNSLPPEVQELILAFLPLDQLFQAGLVCKNFLNVTKRRSFHQARARLRLKECCLSPLVVYAERDSWHLRGFDYENRVWRKLPPFKSPIPAPDPDLFKDFLVAADKGLFCMNVGKASEAEKLYVYNPLSGEAFELPALELSRHPVVISVHVTLAKKNDDMVASSFVVIVIGSAAIGTGRLSRKTDVYDSVKGRWEAGEDVPGAEFSLNEYQTGVYCERSGLLLCVGFMVDGRKGILAFDVEKRKWRKDWICPFHDPVGDSEVVVHFAIAQLVECSGRIYLFSEQEGMMNEEGLMNVRHCIDRLELESGSEGFTWTRVSTREREENWDLLVYPEYMCVPVGKNRLCIYNTIEKSGVVYDVTGNEGAASEPFGSVPPPDLGDGVLFRSLNPVGYAFEARFGVSARPVLGAVAV
ncbi:hypothetical protein KC19_2G038600 [Ceratodon purpureus]|uniref:F-box domain-containing protein n=1 Tax=Ceratodon purpureus TaxID=3225 RepID=A0A8T0IRK2_CERPU|nr:hypothetical protein KC19_2G038600 [Ceratodon purpureus]